MTHGWAGALRFRCAVATVCLTALPSRSLAQEPSGIPWDQFPGERWAVVIRSANTRIQG